ncbi:hypothetical protein ABGB12_28585 [Actinocorallia sp. B10E7]|uniref:hypothetical protein n=1 Tax=Actinocorallia sp. B10E7 TaxID=3153558 RepID=UPI00325E1BF7
MKAQPSRWCTVDPPERQAAARAVHARFTPSELPLLTSSPHRAMAIRAMARTLSGLGRGYLGGHAEITSDGAPPRGCRSVALTECLAVARAVDSALRGGRGTAWLRLPDRNERNLRQLPDWNR